MKAFGDKLYRLLWGWTSGWMDELARMNKRTLKRGFAACCVYVYVWIRDL
jgi:hypothetical protein